MNQPTVYDVIVVGGGPGGMAAAAAAKTAGLSQVLLLERSSFLGGVLPQCIHDGFGRGRDGSFYTGPEYAEIWRKKVKETGVSVLTDTFALQIGGADPYELKITGTHMGCTVLKTRSLILATGCRERTLGQLRVPGSRPAGIYTAGAAQYMMNCGNFLPGKSVVILGSGDIGLIMARRLTLEGAGIKMILGQYASGLIRNYVQCVKDFDIPVRFGCTVVKTHGYQRLKGVTVAPLDGKNKPVLAEKQYVPCDTLLVAVGLIPETELWKTKDLTLSGTGGIPASGQIETPQPGIFACGNVVRIYDSVEDVTHMGQRAGAAAARWVRDRYGGGPVCLQERAGAVSSVSSLGRKITPEDVDLLFRPSDSEGGRTVFCIHCPRGCKISVRPRSVSGAGCGKGEEYAKSELVSPKRVVTTTVPLTGGRLPLLSVRTDRPVEKDGIFNVVKACNKLSAAVPVQTGQILQENIGGTGANLIATADAE